MFWEIAALPIGFLTPFSVRSSHLFMGLLRRYAPRNAPLRHTRRAEKGTAPFFLMTAKKKKKGTAPFSACPRRANSEGKSSMVAAAISQNLFLRYGNASFLIWKCRL
jgi:hypothetical protein